jgi:gas vesicle protein
MRSGTIVLGAAFAVATGVAIGMLFAPEKGSVTRKKISKQGAQLFRTVRDSASARQLSIFLMPHEVQCNR